MINFLKIQTIFIFYLELRQQFFSHCGGSRIIFPGLSAFEDLIDVHFLQSTTGMLCHCISENKCYCVKRMQHLTTYLRLLLLPLWLFEKLLSTKLQNGRQLLLVEWCRTEISDKISLDCILLG